jgi:hypothetical protein
MFTLILALAATGQFRQCQTAATYRQSVQTYVAPVQQYVAPYVEKVAFVAVEDPYYAALVGDRVRAELKAKQEVQGEQDLAARVGQLAEAVTKLEGRISGNPAPPPPTTPTAPDQPPPPTPAPVPPTSDAGQPPAAVLATLKSACLKCHTAPAKAGGGFVMFNEDGSLAALSPLDKVLIDQAVYSGDMPKGGKPLEADAYSALRAWISEDGDAIAAAVKLCQKKGN